MDFPSTMTAVRLHGPRDLRVEQLPHPGLPGPDQALLRVTATTICGSDLHSYKDARVGDNIMLSPLILGHEFAAVVEAIGEGAVGGDFQPLIPGTRVAVDPAQDASPDDLDREWLPVSGCMAVNQIFLVFFHLLLSQDHFGKFPDAGVDAIHDFIFLYLRLK